MSAASAKPFKMSDTALKFGPEWLRALSHGDTSSSPPPSPGPITQRYKLADYRYGREEMLALFDRTIKAPDELVSLGPLYVEKTVTPLAFVQMTEEELRLWQQGINSDVVLKLMGRGSGVVGGSGSSGPIGRGRGGSMDRGRGRARGGGGNLRGVSYDEDADHRPGSNSFGRGGPRPFERSQSNSERPWPERAERNGNEDWNGPASPKKEFGRPYQDNWRSREAKERERERERAEHKEEEDGWRTAGRSDRWARPGWRGDRESGEERGSRFFPKGEREGGSEDVVRRPRAREDDPRQAGNFYAAKRSSARLENDVLPEWASEELHEGGVGGTFDSSGAFRGETWSEDEEQGGPKEPLVNKPEPMQPVQEEQYPATSESVNEARKSPMKEPVVAVENSLTTGKVSDKPLEPVYLAKEAEEALPPEDDLQHAQAVASTLVAHLVEDEELTAPSQHMPEQWLYRDPQGHVQGPFGAAEMAEWFNSGYFTMALSVKRTIDERFVQLGELTKLYGGRLPFLPGPSISPLKAETPTLSTEQEKLQILHQQVLQQQLFQQQLMQQQLMLRQQEMQATLAKLSQMDGWGGLSAAQQQQILNHHLMASSVSGVVGTDRLLQQLRAQMEAQAKLQSDLLQRKDPMQGVPVSHHGKSDHDPIQSFMEQLLVQPKPLAIQKPVVPAAPSNEADPIQNFLQQMQWGPGAADLNGQDPAGNQAAPGFQGLIPGQGLVPWPPQQAVNQAVNHNHYSLADEPNPLVWDMNNSAKAEEKKRLLEQQQQQQQLELQRRQEEEERRAKEEERRMKEEEQRRMKEEEERKRREEERRIKEEEELQKRREEEEKKRLEEEKRKREEEKRKKEEEKRRREEEELRQQQAEEERIRREEEKLAEQQRRQQEALQRLQELQATANKEKEKAKAASKAAKPQAPVVAPWAQQQKQQQQATDTLSLSEIQKLQEEKEKQQRIAEALKAEQIANLNAAAAAAAAQQKAITLRWAQQQSQESHAKSLAEIQAEEAAQLAKLKEKERAERAAQQAALNLHSARGWGSNNLGSAWSSGRSAAAAVAQSPQQWPVKSASSTNIGFWDEPVATPPKVQQPAKVAKPAAAAIVPAPASPVKSAAPAATSSGKKNRAHKEEETVKKLFEHKMDAFSQWCHDYLAKIQAQLDIATFVSFLKDVESPYDVQDYVKSYLGDGKDAKEFAKQFLERRSRWRQSQRGNYTEEDNMCLPARAVNPGHAQEFHEVKSKGKKSKKKMQKVDASLLGFSVTASSDRVNVGERDYGDGL